MGLSFWQIAIVVVLLVLLFGRGKISGLMGDLAKGIKSFKKGMAEDDSVADGPRDSLDQPKSEPVARAPKDEAAKS
tara:strand:+ start:245 stop:472 length:228 start_codon:yes stop_codon:yes gene_type:complete